MCGECSRTPEASLRTMGRQQFLRLVGGGVAAAGSAAVLLGPGQGKLFAQSGSSLEAEIETASEKYEVPDELLLAISYVNALWEMPPPGASPYKPGDLHGRGAYGTMQLLQNPSRDTLGRAAALTGFSESRLKTDRASNVLGGAAVLADIAGGSKPSGLEGWHELVAEYSYGPLYSQEVYETLENGASLTTSTGESLTLEAQDVEVPTPFAAQDRAGVRRADYGRASWRPAARGNYTNANRGPRKIDFIVVHVVEGPKSSAINHFKNPSSDVSAHYVVGRGGGIVQCVRNEDIAWQAGDWWYNKRSIGIEHAGYGSNRRTWTDAMYRSSARLSAYISRKYKVPVDRKHIVRHRKVSATLCPGKHFDMDRYLRLIRKYK